MLIKLAHNAPPQLDAGRLSEPLNNQETKKETKMKAKLITLTAAMIMAANASAWTGEIFVSADPTKIKCTVPSMIVGTPEHVKAKLKELKTCGVVMPMYVGLDDDGNKNTVKLKVRNFLRVK